MSPFQRLLSSADAERFERNGYVVIPDALTPGQVRRFDEVLEGLMTNRRSASRRTREGAATFVEDPFGADEELLPLVDHPAVLPAVIAILGWNIHIYSALGIVTLPEGAGTPSDGGTRVGAGKTDAWHRDGGRMNRETAGDPPPRLGVKVAYFLSDVSKPGRGNLEVAPGSHTVPSAHDPTSERASELGTVPICGPPGCAVVFDRRLWHTAGPNRSDQARRAIIVGYAHRWIHPMHDMPFRRRWRGLDPVRRQLLGEPRPSYGRFFPTADDVPLRAWAETNGIATDVPTGSAPGSGTARP